MSKSKMVQQISADSALTSIRNTHFACKVSFNMPQQTKLDRKAQADAEEANNAYGALKVRRRLYAKHTLDPFTSLAAAARNYLRTRTTQMGDIQLLSKEQMFEVIDTLENRYFVQWSQQKTVFGQEYAKIMQEAEQQQGDLFDASVYPDISAILNQFTCSFDLYPVGDVGGGIFDDLEAGLAADVAARVEATTMRNIKEALAEPLARLVDAVMNIHNKTSREKSRIHNSVMGELEEITALIPSLNVVGLPYLNDMAAKCREELLVPTDSLKGDTSAREGVAEASESILKELGVDTLTNAQSTSTATDRKQTARETADDILSQMKGLF